jgi:hypothetical protein
VKLCLFVFSLILLLPLMSYSKPENKKSVEDSRTSQALTRELVNSLLRSKDLRINATARGCQTVEGSVQKPGYTIGDYLSFLISSLDISNGQSGVISSCNTKLKNRECELMFKTGQGTDSPWAYGIKFQIDSNGHVLPKSLSCPGAS